MARVIGHARRITNGWRLRGLRPLRRTRRGRLGAGELGEGLEGECALEVSARRVANLETLCAIWPIGGSVNCNAERSGPAPSPFLTVVMALTAVMGCDREESGLDVSRQNPILPVDSGVVVLETEQDTLRLRVEIAETPEQKSTGLMERRTLGTYEGMLFLYGEEQPASESFYMFRTRIPLDIAFLDSLGEIVGIRHMEPCESAVAAACERYPPGQAYHAALEVNAGFMEQHGVGLGDRAVLAERLGQ